MEVTSVSRPDHTPRVAVDFAAPLRAPLRARRALLFIVVVALTTGALFLAVTQLLLR